MKKSFLLLSLLILLPFFIFGQPQKIRFKHLSIDNGLLSNQISAICSDKDGELWFATENGLCLFNGTTFENFVNDPNDSTSLYENRIRKIVPIPNSNSILVASIRGLDVFDKSTYQFRHIKLENKNGDVFFENNVASLYYDPDGKLMVGTGNALYVFNQSLTDFEMFEHEKNQEETKRTIFTTFTNKGKTIVGTYNGLKILDTKTGIYTPILNDTIKDEIADTYTDSKNNVWICMSSKGLYLLENGDLDKDPIYYGVENGYMINNRVHSIVEMKNDGYMVVNRDGGIVHLDLKNDTSYHFLPDDHNPESLSGSGVILLYKDSFDNIWIGTYSGGIDYVDNNQKVFELFNKNFRDNGLLSNNVRSMFQDMEGNIWIGTKEGGGLSLFDRDKGTFVNYKQNPDDPQSLHDDYVLSINELDKNRLLIGTIRSHIDVFDKRSRKFTVLSKGMKEAYVSAIFVDKTATIWVATKHYLYTLNKQTLELDSALYINQVRTMLDADDEHIWLGTKKDGLYLFNKKSKKLINYTYDENKPNSISANSITQLAKDEKGNLWIGTTGGGFCMMKKGTTNFTRYTVEDGLCSNYVSSLLIDDRGSIWLSTNNGLSMYNPDQKTFRNFKIGDGLQSNQFELYAGLKTKDGELLFGGRNGFNIFNPRAIKINNKLLDVKITSLSIFNKPITSGDKNSPLSKHISYTKKLSLTHNQSIFTLAFVAINYSSPEKTKYAYMLEGLEKEWNYCDNMRKATYTNLPAGQYTFKVRAANSDDKWNESATSIILDILPPWWETVWFRLLAASVVIGGSVLFVIIRINKMNQDKIRLEKIVDERTKDLQEANVILEESREEINQQNEQLESNQHLLLNKNSELEDKNEEISNTLSIVEMQNINIKASINYAQTIQEAILPTKRFMDSILNNFVVYRPKDIVSGDFYWLSVNDIFNEDRGVNEKTVFVAVVDCTGHGVPGAFMSMIGTRLLNSIVNERKIYEPNCILEEMNKGIRMALKQDETSNDDGMDVCLCKIVSPRFTDKSEGNLHQQSKIIFSGAKRPLYYYNSTKGEIEKIKGSLNTVGGGFFLKEYPYENTVIYPQKGDAIYLTSDGYIDQNNKKRKNFGKKNFDKLLLNIAENSVEEQKQIVETALDIYMKGVPQRDDIAVMGIKC